MRNNTSCWPPGSLQLQSRGGNSRRCEKLTVHGAVCRWCPVGIKYKIIDSPDSLGRDGDSLLAILVPGMALVQTVTLDVLRLRMETGVTLMKCVSDSCNWTPQTGYYCFGPSRARWQIDYVFWQVYHDGKFLLNVGHVFLFFLK